MTRPQDDPPARGADILPFPSRRPTTPPVPAPAPVPQPLGGDSDDDGPSAA
ncbi:hypothetical protein [uncultured Brevundimonas sp.]|uniref:hypothetical protein n=1 Tax=uncultured Brevundimonas sp. TaxID=213418 RepID=UPI0025F222FA|nr:hypothetical protein [uncultured Brevundimonas sp.]